MARDDYFVIAANLAENSSMKKALDTLQTIKDLIPFI